MAQKIDDTDYLGVDEAAGLLGVKRATLYAYVSRGVLRSYRQGVGRKRLYRRADVEALMAVRPSDTPDDDRVLRDVDLPKAVRPSDTPDDDRVLRDVDLPKVETWAGEH